MMLAVVIATHDNKITMSLKQPNIPKSRFLYLNRLFIAIAISSFISAYRTYCNRIYYVIIKNVTIPDGLGKGDR